MTDSVQVRITSCEKCPNFMSQRYYTADSFENVQEWKCAKFIGGKRITLQEWNDPIPKIPTWCPLRTQGE